MLTQTELFVWTLLAAILTAIVMLTSTTVTGIIFRSLKKPKKTDKR
ncbi:MAG: hypothetical protein ACRC5Q_00675 [Culicoidibacterales bacterium]